MKFIISKSWLFQSDRRWYTHTINANFCQLNLFPCAPSLFISQWNWFQCWCEINWHRSKGDIQAAVLGAGRAAPGEGWWWWDAGQDPFASSDLCCPGTGAGTGSQSIPRALQPLRQTQQGTGRGALCPPPSSHSQGRGELGFGLLGPCPAQWISFSSRTCSFSSSAAPWNSTLGVPNFRLSLGPFSLDLSLDPSVSEFSACKMGGRTRPSFPASWPFPYTPKHRMDTVLLGMHSAAGIHFGIKIITI